MSVLLALLAVQPALPAVAPQAIEDEIVVIGRRLKTWRGKIRTKKGLMACKTTKSTGDKAIDAIGCDAMLACFGPLQVAAQAIADSGIARKDKQKRMNELAETATPCFAERREDGVARLAAQRAKK